MFYLEVKFILIFQKKQITCTPTLPSGITIAGATSQQCVIKNSGGTIVETVALTAGTGMSTATFYSGTYTVEHTVVKDGQTMTASESVTFTTSDTTKTSMPTLVNQGVIKDFVTSK